MRLKSWKCYDSKLQIFGTFKNYPHKYCFLQKYSSWQSCWFLHVDCDMEIDGMTLRILRKAIAFSAQELWLPEVQLVTGWMLQCYPGCCYQWSHSQKVIISHSWTTGRSIMVLVFKSCTFRIKSLRSCLTYCLDWLRSWKK